MQGKDKGLCHNKLIPVSDRALSNDERFHAENPS
jgi:hypothetical protein